MHIANKAVSVFQNQVVRPVQTEMHEKLVDAVLKYTLYYCMSRIMLMQKL